MVDQCIHHPWTVTYYVFKYCNNPKNMVNNYEKCQFPIEIFIKKPQNFLSNSQYFFILIQMRKCCTPGAEFSKYFHVLLTLNFSTNRSRFSAKFSRIFIPIPELSARSKIFRWGFWYISKLAYSFYQKILWISRTAP